MEAVKLRIGLTERRGQKKKDPLHPPFCCPLFSVSHSTSIMEPVLVRMETLSFRSTQGRGGRCEVSSDDGLRPLS